MRGNRRRISVTVPPDRSIPACAGESNLRVGCWHYRRVYPRVCGGITAVASRRSPAAGLSPRVRGNLGKDSDYPSRPRSIPACAGESLSGLAGGLALQVYPRVCGGIVGTAAVPGASRWVYPRVCGGILHADLVGFRRRGLSPRVRGNRWGVMISRILPGSIPACAGESLASDFVASVSQVYPRVCGGIGFGLLVGGWVGGLSPRVRGNPKDPASLVVNIRSIPACAGESGGRPPVKAPLAVYPRVCGGIGQHAPRRDSECGLSPRVRGNRQGRVAAIRCRRSIPACAGESPPLGTVGVGTRVYPRVCGGIPQQG